jgi:hypothetical protein
MKEGVYDQLVTSSVQHALDQLDRDLQQTVREELDEAACPDYLARHLIRQIKPSLAGLPAEKRKDRQIEVANRLLSFLNTQCEQGAELDLVSAPAELLKAVYRPPSRPKGPEFPLGKIGLIIKPEVPANRESSPHATRPAISLAGFTEAPAAFGVSRGSR